MKKKIIKLNEAQLRKLINEVSMDQTQQGESGYSLPDDPDVDHVITELVNVCVSTLEAAGKLQNPDMIEADLQNIIRDALAKYEL